MKTHPERTRTMMSLALAAGILATGSLSAGGGAESAADIAGMTSNLHWLGHDSFRIDGDHQVIYIDPYKIAGGPKADLILITHDHSDHASPEDVAKIQDSHTVIVTVPAAAAKLTGRIRTVRPGDKLEVDGIAIEAVPAYNLNKFRSPGVPFHPREAGYAGYIVTVGGIRIYHAGDTDAIPEMAAIHCDVALLPVSGTYVMTAEEAAGAAKMLHTRMAVPMHVGRGIGTPGDAERFKSLATVPVAILPME